MPSPTLGEYTYVAYFDAMKGKSASGELLLTWPALEADEREAWECAARNTLDAHSNDSPVPPEWDARGGDLPPSTDDESYRQG